MMKEEKENQQEQKEQRELSNDELLNVTGGASYCSSLNEQECEEEQHCMWAKGIFGHSCRAEG